MCLLEKRDMKKLVYIITALILTSCYDSALDATDKNSDARLDYLDAAQDPGSYANDEYHIIGVTPGEDVWKVIVQYSGGCEEHSFFSWTDNSVVNNKAQFYLFHNANGDLCEALVRDTVYLNMSEVFATNISDIDITLNNPSTSRPIEIRSDLRSMTQGEDCYYEASFIGTSCGQGIWNNQWFSLADSLADGSRIWFQPIKNSMEVDLQKPDPGKYEIGVTFLFGYQYLEDAAGTCQSIPEGAIVPVAINCLEPED